MEMEQIVVKSEMQPNDEILLFYVDENGENEEGVVTTIDNIDQIQQTVFVQDHSNQLKGEEFMQAQETVEVTSEQWSEFETERLLVFYVDNKETFMSGATKMNFLWSIACKTMLTGKDSNMCETKLWELKAKYAQSLLDQKQGQPVSWQYYDLAHQAFHNDEYVKNVMEQADNPTEIPITTHTEDGIVVVKRLNTGRSQSNNKVVQMLNLYLKYKNNLKNVQKDYWQKGLWETIALEMGEDNAEYWHKRFLNFKSNYIRLLDKRQATGAEINWPYMELFDQIYADDEEFQKKYRNAESRTVLTVQESVQQANNEVSWNETEITVLVKYCYDGLDEFQDPTIPNAFLWNEVGRLLDKSPEQCKEKYNELKEEHYNKLMSGSYCLDSRVTYEIVLDNIISKETELELTKPVYSKMDQSDMWKTQEIDEMAQYLYTNMELFKDTVCYYVCWSVVSKLLKRDVHSCRRQWQELVALYGTILEDKKENPDMQIDWRYIDLFDRLFDYGMDEKLLKGYENLATGGTKIDISSQTKTDKTSSNIPNGVDDDAYDELDSKSTRGDPKAFKILEFYLKNKDKFTTSRKQGLWSILGKQIGMSPTQCAHRFRNLKQVYTAYVQREINKPEMPIVWPYYQLCKKVFGYRALKNKLKNSKVDSDDSEEWSPKEIKELIAHFSRNFNEINEDASKRSSWSELSKKISKSENACKDKFLELRKSYRKLKTMKTRNPAVKVTWKYFNMFDELYNTEQNEEPMEIESYEVLDVDEDVQQDLQDDDDIQCIIVIPEGQDISDLSNAQIITQTNETTNEIISQEVKKQPIKWTKKTKKRLLIHYWNYVKSHKGQEIDSKEMWSEIASKLKNKTALSCRKMLIKMKRERLNTADEEEKKKNPYYDILEKVVKLKPKFKKIASKREELIESNDYRDTPMANDKVKVALQCYLHNIEEFVSPRFEQKYAWSNLAEAIDEPVNEIYNKINYLKTTFNEANIDNETAEYADILKRIQETELVIKANSNQEVNIEEENYDVAWDENETEQLLIWYLANLEKFKNPKYVRKYLWIEASHILNKSPLACSKKMSEIRTEYRNLVKENSTELNYWRFYELCQKIYGTGKQKVLGQE